MLISIRKITTLETNLFNQILIAVQGLKNQVFILMSQKLQT